MGVKTTLAGVTLTTQGKAQAAAIGMDAAGMLLDLQRKANELSIELSFFVTNVLTPAGTEASNITTFNNQITALD